MTWYSGPNPNYGSYNVPNSAKITGAGKYEKTISASANFIATGSVGGVIAISTLGGCTVTLVGGGILTLPANSYTPVEASVYEITAGSANLYYR